MTIRFEIPPLYCPLPPPHPHPDETLLEKRGLDQLDAWGLFADPLDRVRAAATRSHELMARMTPDAPADRVQLGVDWSYLAFSFDDRRTDSGPASTDTAELCLWFAGLDYAGATLDTAPLPDDVFYPAVADISARIQAATTPALWHRWITSTRAMASAALWEAAHRITGRPADFATFLTVRPDLGMGLGALVCAEIAAGLRVPEEERHDPLVRAVVQAAGLLITLDNDLYSFPKEDRAARLAGRDPLAEPTPVPILMREHGSTVAEAALRLTQIRDRILDRALRLAERGALRPYSDDTHALIGIALRVVSDHLDWATRATRYTDPDGTDPDTIDLRWNGLTHTPPADDRPLPYPAVSWWWDID
ncbi:terpene synthase family protein [Streptomyces sp. NPDC046203]|uniref:terpene synthase family protein n=1 Tax=Streptomyces sp. NPDC046203 TaxID=3154602 RepID=UPI0033D443AD